MIINITQHKATPEQIKAGTVDLPDHLHRMAKRWLTFPTPGMIDNDRGHRVPDIADISEASYELVNLLEDSGFAAPLRVMIGGAAFLMPELCRQLKNRGYRPVCSFSDRISTETVVDGKVEKRSTFAHKGFISL